MSHSRSEFLDALAEFLADRGLVGEEIDPGELDPEDINFHFAPIERSDEIEDPDWIPTDRADIGALQNAPTEYLEAVGMQIFRTFDDGAELWLFPVHWYEHLPEGIEVCLLWREWETFSREAFMKEARFGALPFGLLRTDTNQAAIDQTDESGPGGDRK